MAGPISLREILAAKIPGHLDTLTSRPERKYFEQTNVRATLVHHATVNAL